MATRSTRSSSRIASLSFFSVALLACEAYEAPPSVELVAPETGTFFVGAPVELRFDVAIRPSTLAVRVWPDARDIENELPPDTKPLLDRCTEKKSPCGTTRLTVHEDRLGATLEFDPEDLGKPDVPLLVEVLPGLETADGVALRRGLLFDFQFKPEQPCQGDVEFDAGAWLFVAQTTDPVPAILNLMGTIELGAAGRFAFAAAEADPPTDDIPKNTNDPTKLEIDVGQNAFAIHAYGCLREVDGERFFENDPIVVKLTLGPVVVSILDTRLTGKISKGPNGKDRIDGTMSFSGVELGNGNGEPFVYPAGSTTFEGLYVAPEDVPEGTPEICGDVCGIVPMQCEPPEGFPSSEFCGASPTE